MREDTRPGSHAIGDAAAYLASIEDAWQRHDGKAAVAAYSDDAVLVYGNGLTRSGEALRTWPQRWFDYAKDLRIRKTLRAFTGDCLASEWESTYTHPTSGKKINERGAEILFIGVDGKVYLHHMYEHTWVDGEQNQPWPTI